MVFRFSGAAALVVALASLTGCSGSADAVAGATASACTGTSSNAVCLDRCSLGCRGTTCEITEIAQNENLVFVFSQAINPLSVNESTIQLRTASGSPPVGEFLVNDQLVEFRPSLLEVGGQTFFGFQSGETYTLTIPGGVDETNSLRSTAGDAMLETISCTLNVSRGIVDLNQSPPRANLVAPTVTQNVPQDAIIRLEFNEFVDPAPFQTGQPVQFIVRRTLEQGGVRICAQSQPVPLNGAARLDMDAGRGISILTFTPSSLLPGNACVQVTVTDQVRDLSGRSASPQTFQFITVPTSSVEQSLTENFDDDQRLDRDASAGEWANGRAVFGPIGGDGRHGTFSLELARELSSVNGITTYEIDTDLLVIPAENTLSGNQIAVTDGRYFFDEMVVPNTARILFTGSNPPQFTVRGRLQIDGEILLQGESLDYTETVIGNTGQQGGAGGIFAGDGGKGANRCLGVGALPAFNGQNGGDCRVLATHAFAGQLGGTGGRGSVLWPADGLGSTVTSMYPPAIPPAPNPPTSYSLVPTAGGSGGGLFVAGGVGRVLVNPNPTPSYSGPNAVGGLPVNLLPVPAGSRSSVHLLVGGSGGGGGGSHSAFQINLITNNQFAPGCGGGGGGGAIALRAGDFLRIGTNGLIRASGGSAGVAPSNIAATSKPSPGGGGSGGSVLMQSGRVADVLGSIDVRGGTGGAVRRSSPPTTAPFAGGRLEIVGGDGSRGMARLELPVAPAPTSLSGILPTATADNVGQLSELDDQSGFQSSFYSTGQAFGPEFTRYEITAVVDGVTTVFSDDPAVGTAARFGSAPFQVFWQGGTIDLVTEQVDLNRLAPWRSDVGAFTPGDSLATDALNAFRFLMVIDHTLGVTVEIESVRVLFRV